MKKYFLWDWKGQPPIAEMIKSASKIKNAKLWWVDSGCDTYEVVIASTKKEARQIYEKGFVDEFGEKPSDYEIQLWND